jgi:HAE1 family hydrophobic/amphiphilic exporter-1
LTRLALDQPSVTLLVTVLLLAGGIVAALTLKRELVPDVQLPLATVVTLWPGASAEQVTREVIAPMEQALEELPGIEVMEISSRAADGFGALTVRAELGTAQAALQEAIDEELKPLALPEGAQDPQVVRFDLADLPVLELSVSSRVLDAPALQKVVDGEIVPQLEAVAGVSQVAVAGGGRDRILITLDPQRMAAAGVTMEAIQGLLQANNLSLPAGTLSLDGRTVPLQVGHRIRDVDELRRLAVSARPGLPGAVPGGAALPGMAAAPAAATRAAVAGLPDITATIASALAGALAEGLPDGTATATAAPGELGGTAPGTAPPAATAAPARRLRVVVVAPGDTLPDIARRFGADPAAIRAENDLSGDDLTPGSVLRVPLPVDGRALPAVWASYGASRPGEISAEALQRALNENPRAVSDLLPEHLLQLPDETVRVLPLPFILRQPEAVRSILIQRFGRPAAATPTPALTPAAASGGLAERRWVGLLAPAGQAGATPPEPAGGSAVLPGGEPESMITLGDVATIRRESARGDTLNRTDGQPSLGLKITKDRSANTVTVVDDLVAVLDRLADDYPGVQLNVVFEQATFIESSLAGVRNEALLGALFAVLVILLFLDRSVRATLVVAVSIPLSVFSAFLLMRLAGITLNLLTLAGMTVAIGRVVDDAIVVLENVYRHIQQGQERTQAVLDGTAEVARAITASTLVTVAVFLPLGLIGGLVSQFFQPFAWTVTFALAASLLVAVTVIPLMARSLLTPETLPEAHETALQRGYARALEGALDHRLATLAVAGLVFGLSLLLLRAVPRAFLPDFGEPAVSVELVLPPGTDLATTDALAGQVEAVLMADPAIGTVETTVGRGSQLLGQPTAADPAKAFLFGPLDLRADEGAGGLLGRWRPATDDAAVDEAGRRVREQLQALVAGQAVTLTVRAGALGGPPNRAFDLQVLGEDPAALRAAQVAILAALQDPDRWQRFEEVPLINLRSTLGEPRPVVEVQVDAQQAAHHGLTTAQAALALRQALAGQDLGMLEVPADGGTERLAVVAVYPGGVISHTAALADYRINGPLGPVSLGQIATIQSSVAADELTRIDGRRALLISADITAADALGALDEAHRILDELPLPEGVTIGAGAESSQQRQGFRDMLVALPLSILIVYLILVSLPFAVSGALVGLALTDRAISIGSLIGMMMLIGIVVTNAIVLVDLVQQLRARGLDPREALLRGGRTRLRPILMTALATICALIPRAIGFTEGALVASELATTVIGGLATSTLLMLFVVPVVYSYLDPWASRRRDDATPAEQPSPVTA